MLKFLKDNWFSFFESELVKSSNIKIVSPFVSKELISWLLEKVDGKNISFITRFKLNDFYEGVSQLEGIEMLVKSGAAVRGIKGLHSKLYLFDNRTAVITSANFTRGGFKNNFEFGTALSDAEDIRECSCYYEYLWNVRKHNLVLETIESWKKEIEKMHDKHPGPSKGLSLPDEGAEVTRQHGGMGDGGAEEVLETQKYYVKFLGSSNRRVSWAEKITDTIERSGCNNTLHWPQNRRPNSIVNNEVIYIAHMTGGPDDYAIFGKAVANAYDKTRDNATDDDIKKYEWKRQWPHYIRVSSPVFIKGKLSNCIKLKTELINKFGTSGFASTLRNSENQHGNTNPLKSLMQQPGVALTYQAGKWLDEYFDDKLEKYGQLEENEYRANPSQSVNEFIKENWAEAKVEIKNILIKKAQNQSKIYYSDLAKKIRSIKLRPEAHVFHSMLDEISREEFNEGKGMLSVLVVQKNEKQMPGKGFFKLARKLYNNITDKDEFYAKELRKVYTSTSKRGNR
jgi:hypothetical protein